MFSGSAHYGAPLCPAGHLPHKGGDRAAAQLPPIAGIAERTQTLKLSISPLVGEMSGGTEGGVGPPSLPTNVSPETSQ